MIELSSVRLLELAGLFAEIETEDYFRFLRQLSEIGGSAPWIALNIAAINQPSSEVRIVDYEELLYDLAQRCVNSEPHRLVTFSELPPLPAIDSSDIH